MILSVFTKIWKPLHAKKPGFTIAEVIIAATIFTVVGIIAITTFVNIMRIQQRIALENAIYEDGRFMMERVAREIRQNTIDYEEYYRLDTPDLFYGEKYGCYAQRFYNPGTPPSLGAVCNDGSDPTVPGNEDCIIDKNSLDINTGQNPYIGYTGTTTYEEANALCDELNHGDGGGDCASANAGSLSTQQQLFLINPSGTEKTFIALKSTNELNEHTMAMLQLAGKDVDTDGVAEVWMEPGNIPNYEEFCLEGYDCVLDTSLEDNLSEGKDLFKGFVPLTPLRSNVTSLTFYISPIEDPRKAYAETEVEAGIQQQPHVTIVMTLQPAASELGKYDGEIPTITLQTTVATRVYNEVKSYRPEDSC